MTRLRALLATLTDLATLPQSAPEPAPTRPAPEPVTDAECVAGLNALYPDAHPADDWSDTELRTMAAVIRAVDRARTGDQQ